VPLDLEPIIKSDISTNYLNFYHHHTSFSTSNVFVEIPTCGIRVGLTNLLRMYLKFDDNNQSMRSVFIKMILGRTQCLQMK